MDNELPALLTLLSMLAGGVQLNSQLYKDATAYMCGVLAIIQVICS